MNANIVHTILSSPWMIAPQVADNYLPFVLSIMRGEKVKLNDQQMNRPFALKADGERKIQQEDFNRAPTGSLAIHPISGVILKNDGMCTIGTESMMKEMAQADQSPNIVAHVLQIDSPGGQATNIETVARFIRTKLQKPVVAHVNGFAASAAYYLAAAADEFYASQGTDKVGSVGAMINVMDRSEFFEKNGIKIHEIYASQSDLKNNDMAEVRKGNYEGIRSKLLDPFAAQFIEDVKLYRPGIEDKRVFRGDIFTAKEGMELNLLDGILTFEKAVERAIFLSNQNKIEMDNIQTALGYKEPLEADKNGGIYLQKADAEKLNAQLATIPQELDQENEALTELRTSLQTQTTAIEALQAENTALQTQLQGFVTKVDFEAFKAAAGDRQTSAFSANDPGQEEKKDAADNLEETVHKAAMNGGGVFQ